MRLLVSPHADDESLFCSLTILREKPLVVVVLDGYVQANRGLPVTAEQRRKETQAACDILGVEVQFLGYRDDDPPPMEAIQGRLELFHADEAWAPAFEVEGHAQHNLVAHACNTLPVKDRYLSYTTRGKSTSTRPVPILDGSWIGLKLKALSCYESQFNLDRRMGCWPHFTRDQTEYYQ